MAEQRYLIKLYDQALAAYGITASDTKGLGAVDYGLEEWQGRVCSTCELFNTADVSFVPVYSALPRRAVAQFGLNRAHNALTARGAIALPIVRTAAMARLRRPNHHHAPLRLRQLHHAP